MYSQSRSNSGIDSLDAIQVFTGLEKFRCSQPWSNSGIHSLEAIQVFTVLKQFSYSQS